MPPQPSTSFMATRSAQLKSLSHPQNWPASMTPPAIFSPLLPGTPQKRSGSRKKSLASTPIDPPHLFEITIELAAIASSRRWAKQQPAGRCFIGRRHRLLHEPVKFFRVVQLLHPLLYQFGEHRKDRKSTRLNSSHVS